MLNAWAALAALVVAAGSAAVEKPVEDFTLRDHRSGDWNLAAQRDKIVVLVFLGCDCPLAKLYATRLAEMAKSFEARGVVFAGINANSQDSPSDIARYVRRHALPFPVLKDVGNHIADRIGALHTPEVFLLDHGRIVRYRGRIDDQYTTAVHGGRATRHDLRMALEEVLAGKVVTTPVTEAGGCVLGRVPPPSGETRVTYTRDIAPILNKRCIVCHRQGQIAPFSLTSYQDASGWAETIRQVVAEGRMPPWSANPNHGTFANDPSLSADEKRLVARWVRDGCPEGDHRDLPPAPVFPEEWAMGRPDLVLSMAKPFTVPAEGVVEYQSFEVDPGFKHDTWVRAAEIQPGNRAVVHHCTVFLKPPGGTDVYAQGRLGSFCLAAMALGSPPLRLPPGMAKLVPAGWHLVFVVHYTPVGSVQTDQTRIGLWLTDPQNVQKEVATKLMFDLDLAIPPHVKEHQVTQTWMIHDNLVLLGMFPHMHLRGKSFRYEVVYPDQSVEILLDVPRYDFNWQHRYELAEPKRLPKGSLLRCTAVYDNSPGNPANPDPSATVRAGTQSWEEMFNGYWDVALADQDLTRESSSRSALELGLRRLLQPSVLMGALGLAGIHLFIRRKKQSQV